MKLTCKIRSRMTNKRKSTITLLEVMIVVLLIGIIGSVLGFNMKGSLDEGKVFKSREGSKQLRDILLMQETEYDKLKAATASPETIKKALIDSKMVSNVEQLMKDGWGNPYDYEITGTTEDFDLKVTSKSLTAFVDKKKSDKSAGSAAQGTVQN